MVSGLSRDTREHRRELAVRNNSIPLTTYNIGGRGERKYARNVGGWCFSGRHSLRGCSCNCRRIGNILVVVDCEGWISETYCVALANIKELFARAPQWRTTRRIPFHSIISCRLVEGSCIIRECSVIRNRSHNVCNKRGIRMGNLQLKHNFIAIQEEE